MGQKEKKTPTTQPQSSSPPISNELESVNIELRKKIETLEQQNRELGNSLRQETEKSHRHDQLLLEQIKVTSISQMLSAIAHHWRQPLTSVGFILQNIKTAFKKGIANDDYIDNSVQKGMKQIKMMSNAIDEFQNFLKPGKKTEPIDSVKAISEILSILSPQIQNHSINVDIKTNFDTENNTAATIIGLPFEFKQVLTNIINNAIFAIEKKMAAGRLKPGEGKISIHIHHHHDSVSIKIINNGPSIPEDIIDRMFEPFFSAAGGAKGLGVGLYMAKFIIEGNMGGKIRCSNINIDEGVMFDIELKAEG
jgi:signal transduction histidine kinase